MSGNASASPDSFAKARELYYQGIYGDKAAGSQADELLTKLHGAAPADPLVNVYFGSTRLLEAEHTWALWKKNALSKEGIQWMDTAVAAAPESLEVRFVRGATERELPSFFGRKRQAQEDIRAIATNRAVTQPQVLEPRLAAATFYYYGLDCLEAGKKAEGMEALRTAIRTAPDSHSGRLAAEKLKALL